MTSQWWKSAVVYQVYPRSFCDSSGTGVGDINGVRSRLDYLQHLGVDVIWLSPIYKSPQNDNGYDISDYRDIDPLFGTLDEFDALLRETHERGMKFVMDLVVNHTSDEHAWFSESRSSKNNPKRDWYWWRPPRDGMEGDTAGAEPNNWESWFSGPAWKWDEATGEYFLHIFSEKQPDLNWENPEVRSAVYEMMNWWLDRGVDGFRMDVVNMLSKVTTLPDGPSQSNSKYGNGHPYFINGPRAHEFLQETHREVFAQRDAELLTVGEMPEVDIANAQLFTDPLRNEVDMVFQFEHMELDWGVDKWHPRSFTLSELKTVINQWQQGLAESGWNSLYWCNHDQPRTVSRFGNDAEHWRESAKTLATVTHMQRGTPYVYQGEEIGMTNMAFESVADLRDIESLNHYVEALASGGEADEVLRGILPITRDNARTPVQWDASVNAGFSDGTPWMPVNPNYLSINVAAQLTDDDSILNHYRSLIRLRHDHDVIADGDFMMLWIDHPQLFAFTRKLNNDELLVVANCSDAQAAMPGEFDVESWASGEVLIQTHSQRDVQRLAPWESWVVLRHA